MNRGRSLVNRLDGLFRCPTVSEDSNGSISEAPKLTSYTKVVTTML